MSEVDSYGSEVEASGRKPDVSVPRVEVQRASGWVASLLALAEGTMVISRYQERSIDETPWSMQTTFYPMDWVTQGASRLLIAENITDGIIGYVEDVLGVKQVGLHDLITARVANSHESAFFDLPEDGQVAVFEVSRVGFDENSNPLRLTVTVYPADRELPRLRRGAGTGQPGVAGRVSGRKQAEALAGACSWPLTPWSGC